MYKASSKKYNRRQLGRLGTRDGLSSSTLLRAESHLIVFLFPIISPSLTRSRHAPALLPDDRSVHSQAIDCDIDIHPVVGKHGSRLAFRDGLPVAVDGKAGPPCESISV